MAYPGEIMDEGKHSGSDVYSLKARLPLRAQSYVKNFVLHLGKQILFNTSEKTKNYEEFFVSCDDTIFCTINVSLYMSHQIYGVLV